MRTLRLYINNQLDQSINWTLAEDGQITDNGSSFLNEFSGFENVQIEAYLNAGCCSIFKTNKVSGIRTNRLTDELVLGLIEEDLVDDIEALKPVMMRIEDNLAYIAIFNRDFYEQLISQLINLDKPIKLIQSYVYSTSIDENAKQWVLYLSPEQNFVRTSQFQYYLLDDYIPLPELFEDMLINSENKPEQILIYSDQTHNLEEYHRKFNIPFIYAANVPEFGIPIWNFYNQKSSSFKLKLEPVVQNALMNLLKTVKYFVIMVALFWTVDIINLYINKHKVDSELKTNMAKISKVDAISPATLNIISKKLTDLTHERGLYMETDFVPMFGKFLKVAGIVEPDDITQVEYSQDDSSISVFLRNFPTDQFQNYRDIFKSQHIIAEITDYKAYVKAHKTKLINSKSGNSKADNSMEEQPLTNDTKWVITLHKAWLYETL